MAQKTKLSAKAVLIDLKAGLSDDDLMRKYRISAKGLQSLFDKLLKAGMLEQSEIDARTDRRKTADQSTIQSQKLAQLKDALESGILSKEEFERKRAELGIASGSPRIEPPRSQTQPRSDAQWNGEKASTPEDGQEPWYQTPVGIIVLVTCFFPVGLYLLWKSEKFTPRTKKIITGVVAAVVVIGVVAPKDESKTPVQDPTVVTQSPEPVKTIKQEPRPSPPPAKEVPDRQEASREITKKEDLPVCTVIMQQGAITTEEAFYEYITAAMDWMLAPANQKAATGARMRQVLEKLNKEGKSTILYNGDKVVVLAVKDFTYQGEYERGGMAKIRKVGEKKTYWMASQFLNCQ